VPTCRRAVDSADRACEAHPSEMRCRK
jgi:hypothetical protein